MSGITVNGKSLDAFLSIAQFKDNDKTRHKELREKKFIRHQKVGNVPQAYDESPSIPIQFSKGKIKKIMLEKYIVERKKEFVEEATKEVPVFRILLAGALIGPDWKTSTQLMDEINAAIKKRQKFNRNSVSSLMSKIIISKAQIARLIERNRTRGPVRYRFFSSCAKIELWKLADMFNLYPSFTLTDALQQFPELREEIREGNPILQLKNSDPDKAPATKAEILKANESILMTKEKSEENGMPFEKSKPFGDLASAIENRLESEEEKEIKINISVNFGPIRILFGLERYPQFTQFISKRSTSLRI